MEANAREFWGEPLANSRSVNNLLESFLCLKGFNKVWKTGSIRPAEECDDPLSSD